MEMPNRREVMVRAVIVVLRCVVGARRRMAPSSVRATGISSPGKCNASLPLILAATILVTGLADLVGFQEQHLRDALVGVDFRRQRGGVGEFQRHVAFPFGFQW